MDFQDTGEIMEDVNIPLNITVRLLYIISINPIIMVANEFKFISRNLTTVIFIIGFFGIIVAFLQLKKYSNLNINAGWNSGGGVV